MIIYLNFNVMIQSCVLLKIENSLCTTQWANEYAVNYVGANYAASHD